MSRAAWDVIVVGGGFAGLAAAREAAGRGLRTLVVERMRRAGERVRTTGLLDPDGLAAVRPPERVLGPRLDALAIHGPLGAGARITRPGFGFTATATGELLEELEERAAAAGAVVRHGVLARGVEQDGGHAVVDAGERLRASWIIAADGARSVAARSLRLPARRSLVGVERHFDARAGELDAAAMTVHVDGRVAPGYLAWAFRGWGGAWQVGLLGRPGRGWQARAALDRHLQRLERTCGFRPGPPLEERTGLVPVSGPLRRSGHRVAIVGDAAGHVSPLTAGGIGRAVEAGEAVGRCIEEGPAAWSRALADVERVSGGWRLALRWAFELTRAPGVDAAAVRATRIARPWVEELAFRTRVAALRTAISR